MGWLIALAVLTAIGMIPLGVGLSYEMEKFQMKIRICGFSFSLPMGKKKEKQEDKQAPDEKKHTADRKDPAEQNPPKTEQAAASLKLPRGRESAETENASKEEGQPAASAEKQEGKKPDLRAYLPFVRLAVDFLGSLRRKLRIEKLYGTVILAGDDPCDLAVLYGCAQAGVSDLMAHINHLFAVEKQDVKIECDFTAEKTVISGRLDLTITIGRALSLAAGYGIRALKEYLIFKKRKGGAAI